MQQQNQLYKRCSVVNTEPKKLLLFLPKNRICGIFILKNKVKENIYGLSQFPNLSFRGSDSDEKSMNFIKLICCILRSLNR